MENAPEETGAERHKSRSDFEERTMDMEEGGSTPPTNTAVYTSARSFAFLF